MPSISNDTRIILWVLAAIFGGLSAVIGNVLAINIVYFFTRRGRRPTRRPIHLWIIFYFSASISVALGAVAAFAPVSTKEVDSSIIATPSYSSNSIRLIPIGGQNIVVKLGGESLDPDDVIPLNETITVSFKILNNGTSPVTIKALVIGSRGPGVSCENPNVEKWSAPDNPFPTPRNITIQPGEEYEYQGSRAFYLPGNYFLEPIIQGPNDNWGGIQPFSCISITVDGTQPSQTETILTPSSVATQVGDPANSETPTKVSDQDGMTMIFVPVGEFTMGKSAEQALSECQKYRSDCHLSLFTREEPAHQVNLDSFWIDQTEVTNAMYSMCVQARGCLMPSSTNSKTRQSYYDNPQFAKYPVIFVTWNDAKAYCEWAGRRLPSEAEWEKAASWDPDKQEKRVYPWGSSIDCSYANYGETCIGDTTEVGSYQLGASFYGILDMVGNVGEWVSSLNYQYPYVISDGREDLSVDGDRIRRGSSWYGNEYDTTTTYRLITTPRHTSDGLGFRCASSQ